MRTIRFNTNDPKLEEALRIITFGGQVEHTGEFGVYRVPNDTLALLDERKIEYEIVKPGKNGNALTKSNQ